jgi:hypothetical protein
MPSKRKKKRKTRLPDEILVMPNKDKDRTKERWYAGRNPLDIVSEFRLIAVGPPNSGKSNCIKNIILRCEKDPFQKITVVHYGAEGAGASQEWDDMDADVVTEIPDPMSWDGEQKEMLVLEDLCYSNLSKEERAKLGRTFGYASSHNNLSVCLTAQDMFSIPVSARRQANVFVIYRSPDLTSLTSLGSRVGLKPKDFREIFSRYIKGPHDFLMCDLTKGTPYPLRINGYQMLKNLDDGS